MAPAASLEWNRVVTSVLQVAHLSCQVLVGCYSQLHALVDVSMREECRILVAVLAPSPNLHGYVLRAHVLVELCSQVIVLAVECYACCVIGLRTVSYACHLEVVQSQESVGDSLVEVQSCVILYCQDSVGWLSAAEEAWTVCVLDTRHDVGNHSRCSCRIDRTNADCTEVISLVHLVVHEHLVVDAASVALSYHIHVLAFGTVMLHDGVISVEVHNRRPVLVALCRSLSLQLDVAESVVVDIEVVEHHVHVLLWSHVHCHCVQTSVIYPLIGWLSDSHVGT